MKITYIHHSSFLVETEHAYLLFDYFKGELPVLNPSKPVYIFASHHHKDHFSKIIFEAAKDWNIGGFLLSGDIFEKCVPKQSLEKTMFLEKNEEVMLDSLKIRTFRSTDEGVAFLVEVDFQVIYHAGDLNDWTWVGESPQWNTKMRRIYQKVVDGMKEISMDVAFLPLDPRQEAEYYQGFHYFMENVAGVKCVFPMHFWGNYSIIRRLKEMPESAPYRDKVVDIAFEGQEFTVEKS